MLSDFDLLLGDILHTSTLIYGPGKEAVFNRSIILSDPGSLTESGPRRVPYAVQIPSAEIPFEPVEMVAPVGNPFLAGTGELSPILRATRRADAPQEIDLMAEHIRLLQQVDWGELDKIQKERQKEKRPQDRRKINTGALINILNRMGYKINVKGKPSKRIDVVATLLTYRPLLEQWERQNAATTIAQQNALYQRMQEPRFIEAQDPAGFAQAPVEGPTVIGFAPYAEGNIPL